MPISNPRVRAILFDVDGTLYRHTHVRQVMIWRLLRAFAGNPRQGLRTLSAIRAYRHAQEQLRRRPPSALTLADQQLHHAAAACHATPEFVAGCVGRWMEQEPLDCIAAAARPGLRAFLELAKREGMRLAVCSDYPAHAKLEALGIAELFDVVVCAQDEGVQAFKPEPVMLYAALDRLGATASEALYIGDRDAVDGQAATAAGIRFVRIGGKGPHAYSSFAQIADALGIGSGAAVQSDWGDSALQT